MCDFSTAQQSYDEGGYRLAELHFMSDTEEKESEVEVEEEMTRLADESMDFPSLVDCLAIGITAKQYSELLRRRANAIIDHRNSN